jgi:hypothetical protein
MLAIIGPIIRGISAGGVLAGGLASRIGLAVTMIPVVVGVIVVIKSLLVVIVAFLSYQLVPVGLDYIADMLPTSVQSFNAEAAYLADKFALKEALGLLFAAFQVRFLIRRLF